MAYLLLDLDLTAIKAAVYPSNSVHDFHTLSSEHFNATVFNENLSFDIYIINPDDLSKLIETAFRDHDGVIILTAGAWDKTMRNILADNLNLTQESKQKLRECRFHSVLTDVEYFNGLDIETIRGITKNHRLDKIITAYPELSSNYYAALDDDLRQINSLNTHPNVIPIHATTHIADKTFYDLAAFALDKAKSRELSKARPGFFTHPNDTIQYTLQDLKPGIIRCKERTNNFTVYNIM